MMKTAVTLLALMTICVSPNLPKVNYDCTLPLKRYSYILRSGRYVSIITEKMRDSSPEWAETDTNPPLSARKALDLAIASLQQTAPKWNDESVELVFEGATLLSLGKKKWCWDIHFIWNRLQGAQSGRPYDFHALVLMNGDVIKPAKMDD